MELSLTDRIRGSMLGGAVGDALGAPIEFLSLAEIRSRYGEAGIREYAPAYGRTGAITDDTQMTLFTAEGLIRAWVRARTKGICNVPAVIQHAYLRWLLTQGERPAEGVKVGDDGWLFGVSALHACRAPGNTCLSALREVKGFGQPPRAHNNSKGCGGVMRVAPVGLFTRAFGGDERLFEIATDAAALTHGHPSGSLSAGYFAVTIAALCRGSDLPAALDLAEQQLRRHDGHEEVLRAVHRARALAAKGPPSAQQLQALGGGWVAEEALGIAICCALVATGFSDGVRRAVNHSGDSDSTGAMTGNILGALWGVNAIPAPWLEGLEIREEIDRLAHGLDAVSSGRLSSDDAWKDYPGW